MTEQEFNLEVYKLLLNLHGGTPEAFNENAAFSFHANKAVGKVAEIEWKASMVKDGGLVNAEV